MIINFYLYLQHSLNLIIYLEKKQGRVNGFLIQLRAIQTLIFCYSLTVINRKTIQQKIRFPSIQYVPALRYNSHTNAKFKFKLQLTELNVK